MTEKLEVEAIDIISEANIGITIAFFCVLLACLLSFHLIYKHLRNYTKPELQKHIVRILLMVPIYAIDSFLSLIFKDASLYFDLLRDAYEAYVVYTFFRLLLSFLSSLPSPSSSSPSSSMDVELSFLPEENADIPDTPEKSASQPVDIKYNAEDRVVEMMESKGRKISHIFPLCCLPPFTPGRSFFILCKRLIYQFVIIKPLLAVISIVLLYYGKYGDGDYSLTEGYIYITVIDNISVTVAMYCLLLFYYSMVEELTAFRPIPKFICIKSIILFTFWQGILIGVLAYIGIIDGDIDRGWSQRDVTIGLQDFLICMEMFLLSLLHRYSFSDKEYKKEREEWMELIPCCSLCFDVFCCCCCCFSLLGNFFNVISQRDVIEDGWSTFNLPRSFRVFKSSPSQLDEDEFPVSLPDEALPAPKMDED